MNASRRARFVLAAVVIVAALYAGCAAVLTLRQRSFIYPGWNQAAAANDRFPGFLDVRLTTPDDLRLRALFLRPRGDKPMLLFFHGNGDSLHGAVAATELLAREGYGLLLPEYRGFGGNAGVPGETAFYQDGDAALRWLQDRGVPLNRIVIVGNSLGGGVATELAARHRAAGLVLISAFTSLADAAGAHLRMFPVRLLLRDRFDNQAKLPAVTAPVLILHGDADRLIGPGAAAKLARAAGNATLRLVPSAGHDLAYRPVAQQLMLEWLADLPSSRVTVAPQQ